MNTADLIQAVGYLAADLAKYVADADIQHDWDRLTRAIGEERVQLTKSQIQDLRRYAA